ncbi:WhiB family transcriptional regulator [Streptomyces sp. CA-106110]|uniref:WhiB family transcriptional regulator n=1 Tax=Streptomyces sp. CA-106110 TaxID=3240044 RepID=UPI003D8C6334
MYERRSVIPRKPVPARHPYGGAERTDTADCRRLPREFPIVTTHMSAAETNALIPGITMAPTTAWRQRASCRGADVETFFPLPNERAAVERALELCCRCPALTPCQQYAISRRERYGIWGGLTEEAREWIMRRS